MRRLVIPIFLILSLVGCTSPAPTAVELETVMPTAVPFNVENTRAPVINETPTFAFATQSAEIPVADTPTASASDWQSLPIIPEVSPEMIAVYQRGLERGRKPNRFSKIGDCQNITTYYLAMFDSGSYKLGDQYAYLQPTIDYFKGSWWRQSLAVKGGMNVAAVQNVMWADPKQCKTGETPLQCELRVYNPSFAIISMEESWAGSISNYDFYMRKIVEYTLSLDIVPILATRAETPTQERQINATVAKIAADYHLPLWNFWAATANMPNNGIIIGDGFHLTGKDEIPEVRSHFDDPANLLFAWTQRNLTALQAIDAVFHGVTGQ